MQHDHHVWRWRMWKWGQRADAWMRRTDFRTVQDALDAMRREAASNEMQRWADNS